jgi:hypothetical protein
VRLRGQKRVPRPPARITAWMVRDSLGISRHLTEREPGQEKKLNAARPSHNQSRKRKKR